METTIRGEFQLSSLESKVDVAETREIGNSEEGEHSLLEVGNRGLAIREQILCELAIAP